MTTLSFVTTKNGIANAETCLIMNRLDEVHGMEVPR